MRLLLPLAILLAASVTASASPRQIAGMVELDQFDPAPATPDTEKDWSPAFDAAIAALCPKSGGSCGGVIHVGSGIFPVSRTITVPPGIRVIGNGRPTVVALSRRLCSGGGGPTAIFEFDTDKPGSAKGPQSQGLEHVWLTPVNDSQLYPCGPIFQEAKAAPYPYRGGDGPYDSCYVRDEKGEPRFDGSRMDAVGIRVNGHGLSGVTLDDVKACGMGTGMVAVDAQGFVRNLVAGQNGVGLDVRGGTSLNFENGSFHLNPFGVVFSDSSKGTPPVGVHFFQGLVQAARDTGVLVHSCVNCSMDGMHVEIAGHRKPTETSDGPAGNAIHIDGTGVVRHFRISRSTYSGFDSIEVDNPIIAASKPPVCPVDFVTVDDSLATAWPVVLDVRTDCPLHVETGLPSRRGYNMRLSRANGQPIADIPDFPTASIDSHERGSPQGTTFAMGMGGSIGIGSLPLGPGITLAPAGKLDSPLLNLIGTASSNGGSTEIRFDSWHPGPAFAALKLTNPAGFGEPSLEFDTWSGTSHRALVFGPGGKLGINTADPAARLQVAGDTRTGTTIADSIQVGSSNAPCDSSRRGVMKLAGDRTAICLLSHGAWRWMAIGAAR